jgi:disulfide oxidoreductase YuzD
MSDILPQIQEKLAEKQQFFVVYKNQVNKDLERSGFAAIEAPDPDSFLKELIDFLNEAIKDSNPKLQQLYYLADVQDRHLEHGIILGFIYREWVKVQFRLRQ